MNHFDDLFLQAREISDPAARAAFLDEACAQQPELRDRLDALLADASAADAFFGEDDTVERVSQLVPPDHQDATSWETRFTPTHIGPYRILERIGHGGMGDVFRAVQKEPIRREVALKLIKLGMDTQQVIARFEAERQALALMDHPHIARVLDAGADDLGHPYFVMELVRGVPITQYADEKQLTLRQRLSLMQQVCQAIQHAHSKGVIHRDLKPSNILVSTQDGRPHAKVIDFGIAKATAQPLTDKTLFTQFQQFIGTPQYMSPEQAEGSLDIDTRSDVYALGVLLYELLTGGTPVEEATLRQAALHEIARIIKEQDTPKPSTRLLAVAAPARAWNPGAENTPKPHVFADAATPTTLASLAKARSISAESLIKTVRGELDWLVMKALEKDRTRRYETPNQLSDDIARYLEGQPIVAAPPSSTYRIKKFIRKHRAPVLAAAAVLTLMTAGILGTSWGLVREKAAKEEATQQAKIADQERTRAEAEKAEAQKQKTEADQQRLTAETAKTTAEREREAAELESYIGNLAAAQAALTAHDYPGARARLAVCPEKLRGWEWRFLNKQAKSVLAFLEQHLIPLQFTPDGKAILIQDTLEQCLRLLDHEGRRIGPDLKIDETLLPMHLHDVRFTPDGRHLFVLATHGPVFIFEVETGKLITRIAIMEWPQFMTAGLAYQTKLVISPDGKWFAVTTLPRIYRLDGSYVKLPTSTATLITGLVFLPQSDLVLTYHHNTAQLWKTTGEPVGKPMLYNGPVTQVECSEDGQRFLIKSDKEAQRWDVSAVPIGPSVSCVDRESLVSMSPNGDFVIQYVDQSKEWSGLSKDGDELAAKFLPQGMSCPTFWKPNLMLFSKDSRHILIEDDGETENGFLPLKIDGFVLRLLSWDLSTNKPVPLESSAGFQFSHLIRPGDRDSGLIGVLTAEPKHYRGLQVVDRSKLSLVELDKDRVGYDESLSFEANAFPQQSKVKFMQSQDVALIAPKNPPHDWVSFKIGYPIIRISDFGGSISHLYGDRSSEDSEVARFDKECFKLEFSTRLCEKSETQRKFKVEIEHRNPSRLGCRITVRNPSGSVLTQVDSLETILAACLHPDGSRLFGANSKHLIIWALPGKRELARLPLPELLEPFHDDQTPLKRLEKLQISEDGTRLGLQFPNRWYAQIWDTRDEVQKQKYNEERSAAERAAKQEADRLIQSGVPLLGLFDYVVKDAKRSALDKLALLPHLKDELKGSQNRAHVVFSVWQYRLLAKPQLIQHLRKEGIVASRRAQEALEYRLEELADFKTRWTTEEMLEECWRLLLEAHTPAPFRRPALSKSEASDEAGAILTLLNPATVKLPFAKLCQALLAYRLDASPSTKQSLHDTIEQAGEAGIDLWARLAAMHAEEGRFDDARHCLNRLIPNGESSVYAEYSRDPFAANPDVKTFLIRSSSGDVIQAPDDYQPKGNPKRLSDEAWSSVKQTWEILKKAKSGKQ